MAGSAFFQAFMTSLSVIAASEVGDKTFFIAAVMAMKNNRWVVRLAWKSTVNHSLRRRAAINVNSKSGCLYRSFWAVQELLQL